MPIYEDKKNEWKVTYSLVDRGDDFVVMKSPAGEMSFENVTKSGNIFYAFRYTHRKCLLYLHLRVI